MTVIEFCSENILPLKYLKERIEANSFFISPAIRKARIASEYGHSVYCIYLISKKARNFMLNNNMIDIIASRFSNSFYPELAHLTFVQYNTYFNALHARIAQRLETCNFSPQLCDVGCGVAHVAMIPTLARHTQRYLGIDINQDILDINTFINEMWGIFPHNVSFSCQSFSEIHKTKETVYLFLNTARYFNEEEFKKIATFLVDEKNKAIIIDSNRIIAKILESFPTMYREYRFDSTSIEANWSKENDCI